MTRFDSSLRVFNHQAFVGQHRIALPQQISDTPERQDKTVGLGLAMLDVLGRDNVEKQFAQSGAAQNRLGLGAQRAGRDHQWEPLCAVAHELLRAWKKNVALRNHRLVYDSLARDQFRDMLVARIFAILAQHGREAIAIVESDQPRRIFVERNFDSVGTQHVVERREVERLGVDQRPVEIEYHGANHDWAKLPRPVCAWKWAPPGLRLSRSGAARR